MLCCRCCVRRQAATGIWLHCAALPQPADAAVAGCSSRCAQQQLLFCVAMDLPSPGRMVLAGLFMAGSRAIRFLISAAIVMKACQTGGGEQETALRVTHAQGSQRAWQTLLHMCGQSLHSCTGVAPVGGHMPAQPHLLHIAGVLGGRLDVRDANLIRKRLGGGKVHHTLAREIRLHSRNSQHKAGRWQRTAALGHAQKVMAAASGAVSMAQACHISPNAAEAPWPPRSA